MSALSFPIAQETGRDLLLPHGINATRKQEREPMPFQIEALSPQPFAELFWLSDDDLAHRNIRRLTVTEKPGTPCRVSLMDAEIGETVLLLNYEHHPVDTPYRSSHAIFVRQGAVQAQLAAGEVPDALRSRLISMRLFDDDNLMIGADVVAGESLAEMLAEALATTATAYVHLHFAKPGCFAALARRC